MDFSQLFGGQPDYLTQLLTPEQLAQARERAGSSAFMGGLAQLLAATGAQQRPVGTGQAIGQALLGGMQGYQSSFDKTLKDMATSMQINEMQKKAQERVAQQKALQVATTGVAPAVVPQGQTMRDDQGELTYGTKPEQVIAKPFDPEIYRTYATKLGVAPETIGSTIKALQPAREKIGMGEKVVDIETGKVIAEGDKKYEKVDTGTGTAFVDPSTFKQVGFVPKTGGSAEDNKIRSEFMGQAKPHIEITQAYRKIVSAPDTAPGDMSKIFGYMKILDPGSTVREGEYASAENARGVPDSIKAMYNKVVDGTRLTKEQRGQFDNAASSLVQSQKAQFDQVAGFYTNVAKRTGANPENIIYNPYEDLPLKKAPEVPLPTGVGVSSRMPTGAAQALGLPQGATVVVRPR